MKPLIHPSFVKFIVYFNDNQDFFECHEVLEDYWNEIPDRTKEHPLTAYILLATGLYHWRRENFPGALRTLKKSARKMAQMEERFPAFTEGIHFPNLNHHLQNSILSIEARQPFTSFKIELTDQALQTAARVTNQSMHLLPVGSDIIIHKHLLRDRSEVIRLRDEKRRSRPESQS